MTNFEVLVKEQPQFVKEALAHNVCKTHLKEAIEGKHKHYDFYNNSITGDKAEMEFLNEEYHEAALDDIEKKYLGNLIRPFKNKVDYISKEKDSIGVCYILIKLKNDHICLPYFSEKSGMYKGMTPRTRYTLKELGL